MHINSGGIAIGKLHMHLYNALVLTMKSARLVLNGWLFTMFIVLTHPNSRARYLASWEDSSSICELYAAPVAMLHGYFAYGLGCIAYVLFVARFVA